MADTSPALKKRHMATEDLTFVNGGDMLLFFREEDGPESVPIGHCTTHTISISTTTKERAFKATADSERTEALWTSKGVTGLACTISAEGLCFYNETENGYQECLPRITAGSTVRVQCAPRVEDGFPDDVQLSSELWLAGDFVVTKLDRTDPANDDSTYSIELENSGQVGFNPSRLTPLS